MGNSGVTRWLRMKTMITRHLKNSLFILVFTRRSCRVLPKHTTFRKQFYYWIGIEKFTLIFLRSVQGCRVDLITIWGSLSLPSRLKPDLGLFRTFGVDLSTSPGCGCRRPSPCVGPVGIEPTWTTCKPSCLTAGPAGPL